jgi:hypothetical protein
MALACLVDAESGIVLDIGHDEAYIAAVSDRRLLMAPKYFYASCRAGRAISTYLRYLIRHHGRLRYHGDTGVITVAIPDAIAISRDLDPLTWTDHVVEDVKIKCCVCTVEQATIPDVLPAEAEDIVYRLPFNVSVIPSQLELIIPGWIRACASELLWSSTVPWCSPDGNQNDGMDEILAWDDDGIAIALLEILHHV